MSVHYEDGVVFVETSNVYATATYRVTDPDASIARCVERGVELLIRARAMSPAIERVLS